MLGALVVVLQAHDTRNGARFDVQVTAHRLDRSSEPVVVASRCELVDRASQTSLREIAPLRVHGDMQGVDGLAPLCVVRVGERLDVALGGYLAPDLGQLCFSFVPPATLPAESSQRPSLF